MLGNKAEKISILKEKGFKIPETIIIKTKENFQKILEEKLHSEKKYILRPSFEGEDSENKSYDGYFKSIFTIQKNEILELLNSSKYFEKFGGKKEKLQSIIIQEFIDDAEFYGVYFTRNPNNIFEKGFYEISKNNEGITSDKETKKQKLDFLKEKELEILGKRLEKIFHFPQDIEFCIKNNEFLLLQARNITTGNISNYNFPEIKKIFGLYQIIDFDEIGENPDYFSYFVLKNLFQIIFINGKIYFKKTIFPKFLFTNFHKIKNKNLQNFLMNYRKYLFQKFIFSIVKLFCFQKLDNNVLKNFLKNYNYSFLQNENSNLDLAFDFEANFITKYFLKIEKIKNISFHFLEKYKKEFSENKEISYDKNIILEQKMSFFGGQIISSEKISDKNIFIYKGKIQGILTNLENFDKNKKNQILFVENLDFYIFDKLENISGIIVKNGNLLSHNSIILRENKIPSIIKYKNFEKLKNENFIEII